MHFYASRGLNINVSINLQVQSELGCQWSAKNSQKSISLTSDIEIWQEVREKLRIGSAALRPLRARSLSSLLPLPFIARQEAVWHLIPNNRIYLPRIFACTYFRPYMLLGARVCEESVPMPLFSDSSCGRFSSRQRGRMISDFRVSNLELKLTR